MRTLFACLVVAAATTPAFAADPITIDLEKCKFKPTDKDAEDNIKFDAENDRVYFYSEGTLTTPVKIKEPGEYTLMIEASCDEALDELAKISIKIGDAVVEKSFELKEGDRKEYTFNVKLQPGEPKLEIAFLNDAYKMDEYDRNLYIYKIKLTKKP